MPSEAAASLSTYRYLADHPVLLEEVAAGHDNELSFQRSLRQTFPDDAVRLALTLVELRRKAAKKFPFAERMWFDRKRLEQATPWAVAMHKAQRFRGPTWDFCCGAGADSLAIAELAAVTAVDHDPVACLFTELNATVLGLRAKIQILEQPIEGLQDCDGLLHIDPDRRASAAKRAVRIEDYVPGLETLRRLASEFRGGAIKLSPSANFGGKFEDVEIEVISLGREAKEATIWFGELAEPNLWRATLLPQRVSLAGDPLAVEPVVSRLGGSIYDPDPAVVRSGLIDLLCAETGLCRLDAAEEYLTSENRIETPFATGFRVLVEVANNERQIKNALRDLNGGQLEIKARRLPINIDRMHRILPTGGDRPLVLLFARVNGKARAIIAERYDETAARL